MRLYIGYKKDKSSRAVTVPLDKEALQLQPTAQASLLYTLPDNSATYIVEDAVISGTDLIWTPSELDCSQDGRGWAQVVLQTTDGTWVRHGEVMPVIINQSLPDATTTPTVEETWEAEATRINALYQQILEDYNSGAFVGPQGPAGADGTNGTDGTDGISPTVTITEGTGTHTVTITDKDGSHSTTISDGAEGPQGPAGSDATVTAESIGTALGYTPADAAAVSTLQNDITSLDSTVDALPKMASTPVVGQIFQVSAVSEDGKVTMVPVDMPSVTVQDVQVNGASVLSDGVAKIPNATYNVVGAIGLDDGKGIAVHSNGNAYAVNYSLSTYKTRSEQTFISKGTLNNVLAAPSVWPTIADEDKETACGVIGAERKLTDGWVLKGTWTDPATALTLDLSGCTELSILAKITASATSNMATNVYTLAGNLAANGGRTIQLFFKDSLFGISCVKNCFQTSASAVALQYGQVVPAYDWVDGHTISDITQLKMSNASVITSFNVKVYAR